MQLSMKLFHSVGESPMNVMELCQRRVVTVRPHEELSTAARMMRERNVGCLVVVEPGGALGGERPIGMLTDREIVTHVVVEHADPRETRVEQVMTHHPVTLASHCSIEEALACMRTAGVRRVAIVDDRSRLVGILALDDIFEYFGGRPLSPVTAIRRELSGHAERDRAV
jgi:CBS domain-containing protein